MKFGCSIVGIILIGVQIFAQTDAHLEILTHYTDNYHVNATELDGIYSDVAFSLTSKKGAWNFEYTGGGMWASAWAQENYLWSELKLTYTLPLSLYFDVKITPYAGLVHYPENIYSASLYRLETGIVYDSLIAIREELTFSYGSDIRPDVLYDRNIMRVELNGIWDVTPDIALKHSLRLEQEEWTELATIGGKSPIGRQYDIGLSGEWHLGANILTTLGYTYGIKDSNVVSLLLVGGTEYLETDSDSYRASSFQLSTAVYFSSWMLEPYMEYSTRYYDSRKAFLSKNVVSDDTVSTSSIDIGLRSNVTLSPRWFFVADVNYTSSDSNDYYETGSGINAQCGVVVNF